MITRDRPELEENISVHIFSASAAMVGVCLTVIGIIRLVIVTHAMSTFADDLLALDALLFLTACLLAYTAMRSAQTRRMYTVERYADSVFIGALAVMVVACIVIAYAVI